MSSFVIKLIAIITMTMDHYNDAVIGHFTFLSVFGRIAFPLFCFQLVVGYSKTSNVWKYMLRMMLFAVVSALPHYIFVNVSNFEFAPNVMFTLSLGLIAMYIFDKQIDKPYGDIIKVLVIAGICIMSSLIKCEYEIWGVLLILFIHMFYPFNNEINFFGNKLKINKEMNIALFLTGIIIFSVVKYIYLWNITTILNVASLTIATVIPAIIMLLFNGKRGPALKYAFYIYYPIHFLILCQLGRRILKLS